MWDQGVGKGKQILFLSEEKGGLGVEGSELISSSPGIKYEGEVIRSYKRRRNCVGLVFSFCKLLAGKSKHQLW